MHDASTFNFIMIIKIEITYIVIIAAINMFKIENYIWNHDF